MSSAGRPAAKLRLWASSQIETPSYESTPGSKKLSGSAGRNA